MFSLRDVLDIAVQIEQNGEQTYRKAAEAAQEPRLAALLTYLADQEREHAVWLARLARTSGAVEADDEVASMGRNMLRDVVGEQSFSLDDVDLANMESLTAVLDAAVELEVDTIIFYQMLAGFVGEGPSLVHLESIIEEEKRHARFLQEFLDSGGLPTEQELAAG